MTGTCPRAEGTDLLDWWLGDLAAAESDAFEEHLFACEHCRPAAQELSGIETGLRDIVRMGGIGFVPSASVLERLQRDGVRMRAYRLTPGDTVPCTVAADDELVVTRLAADLAGVDEVDVSMTGGAIAIHLSGVPVERSRGEVVFASAGDDIRRLPKCVLHVRLTARTPAGPRVLGDYTLDHTPAS